jgi:hypothetical protein
MGGLFLSLVSMTPIQRAALTGARHRQAQFRAQEVEAVLTNLGASTTQTQTVTPSGFGSPSQSRSNEAGGPRSSISAVLRLVREDLAWMPTPGTRVTVTGAQIDYIVESVRDIPTEPEIGLNLKGEDE